MARTISQGAGTALMCGIAGVLGAPDPRTLDPMLDALDHRGPDDRGVYAADGVALGMTRLAIIDLGGGRQPMLADDGAAALVFNGEIYNFHELRARLAAKGRRFRTDSDTEVLLRAWEEYGESCIAHLSGMFAFAVWDARRRRLFLARDRLGKKPLYYWHDGRHFAFASELKALLRHPGPGRTPDWEAFHHYLAFGYTPSDRSILASVGKLPPAHVAMLEDGVLTLRRYWALPDGRTLTPIDGAIDEVAARVRRDVRDAVRSRLAADVPLGVFLSGGVDSSVIVASMREITSGRIATFSVGFGAGTRSYDELPHARRIAERFETEHHEEILEPDARQLAEALVRHFDEPFADSSAIPTLMIAGVAARHVKVVLSGIGGDEAFAGYPRYLGVRLSDTYARGPRWARTATDAMLGHLPESDSSRNIGDRVRRFLSGVDQPMPDRYIGWTRFFTEHQLASLASDALRRSWTIDVEAVRRDAYARRGHDDAMDGVFRIDWSTYVPDDLLTMADRMTMARSLELRAPFCDHRLIETSLALAPALKTRRLQLKALLKRAFADVLPQDTVRRRKQGFMIPLNRWLRAELRPLMDELLGPDRIRARGFFAPDVVERLRREHLDGVRSHGDRLWTLMMAELWMRECLDHHGVWRLEPATASSGRPAAPPASLRPEPVAAAGAGKRDGRVLIVLVAGVGDFVMGTPALKALRRGFQAAHLTLLTSPHVAELARACPHVDEVVTFDVVAATSGGWPNEWRLSRAVTTELRRREFDLAVNMYGVATLRGALRMWLLFRMIRPCRTAGRWSQGRGRVFDVVTSDPVHEVDAQLALAATLGCPTGEGWLDLSLPASAWSSAKAVLLASGLRDDQPYLVLNAGSRRPEARLPVRTAAAIARAARAAADVPIVLTGASDETALGAAIAEEVGRGVVDLTGKTGLLDLCAILAMAKLVVTTDSGPMHIATATGAPVVALFGPADPARTGPRGRPGQVRVFRGLSRPRDSWRWHLDLPLADVAVAITERVGDVMEAT